MRELVNHSGQMLGEKQNKRIQRLRRNCQEGEGRSGTKARHQQKATGSAEKCVKHSKSVSESCRHR